MHDFLTWLWSSDAHVSPGGVVAYMLGASLLTAEIEAWWQRRQDLRIVRALNDRLERLHADDETDA